MELEIKLVWLSAVRRRVGLTVAVNPYLSPHEAKTLAVFLGHAMDDLATCAGISFQLLPNDPVLIA